MNNLNRFKANHLEYGEDEPELGTKLFLYDDVVDLISDIESKVNDCLRLLESIKCVSDLGKVEECREELEKLSNELY